MTKFSNFKLRTKVLIISMTSMIILGVSLTVVANIFMEKEVIKSLEGELKSLAYSLAYSYDSTTGDYKIDSNGVVTKGNIILTDNMDAIDYLYRKSDTYSSFFYGDTRIATSLRDDEGNRLVNEVAMEEVVQAVLIDGEDYFTKNNIINGVSYYSYFIPVRQTDSVEVIGMVGVYYKFDNSGIMNRTMQMTIIYLVLLVVSSIVIAILCNSISKSIKRAIKKLGQVSKGDLSIELSDKYYKRKDEVGDITKAIVALRDNLKEIITHISDTANNLTDSAIKLNETAVQTNKTTEEVASAVEDIAMGATSQAVETQNATNDVISMGEMISITEKDVTNINIKSEEMRIISKEAMEILEELNNTNDKTKETIHMIADQTSTTNESAQKIKEATAFISSIADETNLLALNASIEAARAGEHGRGFAVVAAQIQKLAEQSNDTTGMIEEVITELLTDTNKAVEIMDEVNSIITEQSLNVEKTKKMFGTVNEGIINSIDGVSTISERMISLNKTKESVIDIVQSLTAIAEQNAASTEETSAAVEELTATMNETSDLASNLSDYAENLKKNVSTFKL